VLTQEVARRHRLHRGPLPQIEQATMVIKAWNAFCEDRKVSERELGFRKREGFPSIVGG